MVNPESQVDPSVVPPLDPSLLNLSNEERAFLHAVISEDDEKLRARILDVQKRAYAQYPYPCIRGFHFVNLMMPRNAIYPTVLEAGKRGTTLFLDLGCCMGTDLRKLVYDGYPASQVLGCDLRPEYIQLGYELFGDADKCPIRFFTSNAFDLPTTVQDSDTNPTPPPPTPATVTDLAQLRGSLTHIYTGALFHLFDEETQYGLAVRLATLLKRRPGAVVFGRHQGLQEEGYIDDHLGRNRYGHSETSWTRLWKKVFAQVESEDFADRVVVQAKLTEGFGRQVFNAKGHTFMLYWSVQIV
ncbi:hypothetical protein BV20DRAFT_992286 [Pilatotrama ljubarskyi]|nr:hypothetical protein BV20DRAFT_992286 [Pilatotrama ljubarskyi]